jgi:hypothetical protein
VYHPWYDFAKFVTDTESTFDDDPSKPLELRRCYLRRKNLRSGYNPKNVEWVTRKEALAFQSKTIVVDTPFGKNMTLSQLADTLVERTGEPWPEGVPIKKAYVTRIDPETGRLTRVFAEIDTVQPIKLHVLRKRHKLGLPLFDPVREYGRGDRLDEELDRLYVQSERQPVPPDAPYFVQNRGFL